MSQEIEELFGEGEGAPEPRLKRVVALLVLGLLSALLGMACSAVPGGILVLLAWIIVEKEMDRVESGFLPPDARGPVAQLRAITWASVVVVVLLTFGQLFLMCGGFYEGPWGLALQWLGGVLNPPVE